MVVTGGQHDDRARVSGQTSSAAWGRTCPWPCLVLLVIAVILEEGRGQAVAGSNLLTQHCLNGCSAQVGCTITSYQCHVDETNGMQVAASLNHLRIEKPRDLKYQYVNLTWKPPPDGSYRDLEGFQINVQLFAANKMLMGVMPHYCFRMKLDSNWTLEYTHHDSVDFFFRCMRLPRKWNGDVVISIASLPLNHHLPKLVKERIKIHAVKQVERWDPGLRRWADKNNALHIRINKPLKVAAFYHLELTSQSRHDTPFRETLPAKSDGSTNFTVEDADGSPHYVIPGLDTSDNYSIVLSPMYQNKSRIRMKYAITGFFSPNFTTTTTATAAANRHRKVGVAPVKTAQTSEVKGHLDGALIAIILVTALLLLLALFVLTVFWRLHRRPHALVACLPCGRLGSGRQGEETRSDSMILPIYCHENYNFVRAVESHVSLLKRYVDIVSIQDRISGSFGSRCLCAMAPFSWVYSEVKSRDAIIYLSPRLAKVARLSNINDLESVSDLDRYCHRALQSLRRKHGRCSERLSPHMVTFDCFQNAERDCLRALGSVAQGIPLFQHQDSSEPLKVASFASGSPKLVNFEALLFQLCQLRDFPHELPAGSRDWHRTREAAETETHLSQLASSYGREEASTLIVDTPIDHLPLETGGRQRRDVDNSTNESNVRLSPNGVHYLLNNDQTELPDSCVANSSWPSELHVTYNDSKPDLSKPTSDRSQTPDSTDRCQGSITTRSVRTPDPEDRKLNWHCGSNVAQGFVELPSFDSGYLSRPFVNPRFDDIKYPKRYPSSPGLTDSVSLESNNAPVTNDYSTPGYESDSDNNEFEYEGKSGALESDKLLRMKETSDVMRKDSPTPMKEDKKGDNWGNQCHIVPPRFLPNLSMGNNSISDLIKGINDKSAWK